MVKRQDMSCSPTTRGFMKEVPKMSRYDPLQSGEANTYFHKFMQLIGCMNPESFAEFSKSPGILQFLHQTGMATKTNNMVKRQDRSCSHTKDSKKNINIKITSSSEVAKQIPISISYPAH